MPQAIIFKLYYDRSKFKGGVRHDLICKYRGLVRFAVFQCLIRYFKQFCDNICFLAIVKEPGRKLLEYNYCNVGVRYTYCHASVNRATLFSLAIILKLHYTFLLCCKRLPHLSACYNHSMFQHHQYFELTDYLIRTFYHRLFR